MMATTATTNDNNNLGHNGTGEKAATMVTVMAVVQQ